MPPAAPTSQQERREARARPSVTPVSMKRLCASAQLPAGLLDVRRRSPWRGRRCGRSRAPIRAPAVRRAARDIAFQTVNRCRSVRLRGDARDRVSSAGRVGEGGGIEQLPGEHRHEDRGGHHERRAKRRASPATTSRPPRRPAARWSCVRRTSRAPSARKATSATVSDTQPMARDRVNRRTMRRSVVRSRPPPRRRGARRRRPGCRGSRRSARCRRRTRDEMSGDTLIARPIVATTAAARHEPSPCRARAARSGRPAPSTASAPAHAIRITPPPCPSVRAREPDRGVDADEGRDERHDHPRRRGPCKPPIDRRVPRPTGPACPPRQHHELRVAERARRERREHQRQGHDQQEQRRVRRAGGGGPA